MTSEAVLRVAGCAKSFYLHARGGVRLDVLRRVDMSVAPGECVVVDGPSGEGKSTLLRAIHGNYGIDTGRIEVIHGGSWVDVASADARTMREVRRQTIAHVGQFLRVIPRVATLDLVAEPLRLLGRTAEAARAAAAAMLARVDLPERLWRLPPQTFSGGEQQRVNIARGMVGRHPILLMDEPTAALDAANRARVVGLVAEARAAGVAVVGVFHDAAVRDRVATRVVSLAEGSLGAT
jgi:alpha-D-ribose 1-methylphosphonate 5-triphosphate synthase subunit PhnL